MQIKIEFLIHHEFSSFFFLLLNKLTETYAEVFKYVFIEYSKFDLNFAPDRILSDFELDIQNAVEIECLKTVKVWFSFGRNRRETFVYIIF